MSGWILEAATLVTAVATIVGATAVPFGIRRYRHSSARAAMLPFLNKQLEIYTVITNITGHLASTHQEEIFREKAEQFWMLYFGSLALYEDQYVESAMVQFGDILSHNTPEKIIADRLLLGAALNLASVCRTSVADSWQRDVSSLGERLRPANREE